MLHTNSPAEAAASRMPAAAATAVAAPATGGATTSSVHGVGGATAVAMPASATLATTAPRPRWEAAAAGAATAWWRLAALPAGRAATRPSKEVPTPAGAG